MQNNLWIKQMNELAGRDPEHMELLARVEALEPEYKRIKAALPPADQEILDDYIAACEELEYHRIFPAYQLGKQHGRLER